MKRAFLAAIALAASCIAQAGDYQCAPEPIGPGVLRTSFWTDVYMSDGTRADALVTGWYCSDGYTWTLNHVEATKDYITQAMAQLTAIKTTDDFKTYWTNNVRGGLNADDLAWLKSKMPAQPSDPIWRVAKNGTSTTRPTYLVTNGVRQTKSNGIISVGVQCTCNRPEFRVIEGTSTYCVANQELTSDGTGFIYDFALCKPAAQ